MRDDWFFYFVMAVLCAAAVLGLWMSAYREATCLERAAPPPCGQRTVCTSQGGHYCYEYTDACQLPGTCTKWGKQ